MTCPALALLLPMLAIPPAQADGRLEVVEGVARIAGTGRPAPFVSLSFSQGGHPETTVTTDADGRFRWVPLPVLNLHAGPEGQQGPICRLQVQDPGRWSWEVVRVGPEPVADHFRRQAEEQILERAETRWEREGGAPRLAVDCPPIGTSEILVLGPDGEPLINKELFVYPIGRRFGIHGVTGLRLSGTTDADGLVRIRWVEGMQRLRFNVSGVGFGSTGWFEVVGGRTARPELTRLARYGEVAGRLAPELVGKVAGVGIGESVFGASRAEIGDDGRFVLRQVEPGTQGIRPLAGPNARIRANQVVVQVAPGRRTEGVVLTPAPPIDEGEVQRHLAQINRPDEERQITWIEGLVTDLGGRPLPGINVTAEAGFNTGIRLGGGVRATTTDERGAFRILGPSLRFIEPLRVSVAAEGRPPAVAYHPAPDHVAAEDTRPPLEVTLADRGGTLLVTVLKDGRPVPDAGVRLAVDLQGGLYGPRLPIPPEARRIVDEVAPRLAPEGRTGPDGVSRFEHLLPGLYQITAGEGPQPPMRLNFRRPGDPVPSLGIAEGVPVAEGRTTEHTVALHPQASEVRFRVRFPDGRPLASRDLFLRRGDEGGGSSFRVDEQGIGTHNFGSTGSRRVSIRFRDSIRNPNPDQAEPYYEATAQVAVSAALPQAEPIELHAVRRDPATLRVQLLDAEGRPTRGTVMLVTPGLDEAIDSASTTDDDGIARFAGLASGIYRLRAMLDGFDPLPIPGPSGLPPDEALRGLVAVFGTSVELSSDDDRLVELRAEPVGYLVGDLRTEPGRKVSVSGVSVASDPDLKQPRPSYRVDRETGLFCCGPLPVGTASIWFNEQIDEQFARVGPIEVDVRPGVNRVDLEPPPPSRAALNSGRLSDHPPGRVFLENGEAPAFAARALLFSPSYDEPTGQGITDASGLLSWAGQWISPGDQAPDGRVPVPTAVVDLPGSNGGVVVGADPSVPTRVVLPPPIDASGLVTIGGRPIGGRPGEIRVVAAHQGVGVLDDALSVTTTAQADGRFELRGLSPGRHLVQASRDGIWASQGVEVRVAEGEGLPPITLDIPEPGAPVALRLVDPEGEPLPDRPFRVVRPEGPLSTNWPDGLRTGPDGSATLRGLEAGSHAVAVEGMPATASFDVPEAVGEGPGPIAITITIDSPGR